MIAVMSREEILREVANRVVEDKYTYAGTADLQMLCCNKLGHDLTNKDVKLVEKFIKERKAEIVKELAG